MTDQGAPASPSGDDLQHFALLYDSAATPDEPAAFLNAVVPEPKSAVWIGGDPSQVNEAFRAAERRVADGAPLTIAGRLEGSVDADELLDRVTSGIASLVSRGHARVYLLGLDTWGAPGWPPPEDVLWFDSQLDAALAGIPATIICAYDAGHLPARAIFYGEEIHRYVSRGGPVLTNPHYVGAQRWLHDRLPLLPWLRANGKARPLHVGAFYRGVEDLYAQLGPQIAEGVQRGERAVHFIDPSARADHEGRLAALGVDVKATEKSGRLDIRGWDEVYLLDGHFDADRQLGLLEQLVAEPRPRTRLVANMSWALAGAKGSDQLISYEARVNPLLDRYTQTVICAYDLDRFDPWTVLGAIRTHPVVLLDGELRENSLYEPYSAHSANDAATNV